MQALSCLRSEGAYVALFPEDDLYPCTSLRRWLWAVRSPELP